MKSDGKIKVLQVVEAFSSGVFVYITQLCNVMCEDFDVYLAYYVRKQTPTDYRDYLDSRVHLIEVPDFGKGIADIVNDLRVIRRLRQIERQIKPDIIHLHSPIAGGLGRLAFSGKTNAVIYTPHGYAHIALGSGPKSMIFKLMENILGKTNSITLTCCQSEDEEAKKFCKRTAYIETGVDIEKLSGSLDEIRPVRNGTFTVFSLGRASNQKQPGLFNSIAELVPEAQFVWIGGGEQEHLLTAPNITVTGWKSRQEALAIAKGADAFILCSLAEAIAMSLLEAMYMKKLCLVSNVIGNKSVIRDGENGYICNTAEEYAMRIREAEKAYPNRLVETAYRDVQTRYNQDVMKHRFSDFYNRLAGARHGAETDETL